MPRRFITSCLPGYLGILLGIITCVQGASSQASERKPNVIVFLADDLGYQELGCYGQKVIQTPSIDALAEKGLRMTQFYSGSPVCAPSRGMLLTGKLMGMPTCGTIATPRLDAIKLQYQWKSRPIPLPPEETTLAEALHDQGYATGAMGKWGWVTLAPQGTPNARALTCFTGSTARCMPTSIAHAFSGATAPRKPFRKRSHFVWGNLLAGPVHRGGHRLHRRPPADPFPFHAFHHSPTCPFKCLNGLWDSMIKRSRKRPTNTKDTYPNQASGRLLPW